MKLLTHTIKTDTLSLHSFTGCDRSLGMENDKIIDKCQVWASSAVNESYSANMVRTSSPSFWSPPLDIDIEHWIQIDFRRLTKVTKVALRSVPKQARVSEVLIQSSFDGNNWKDVQVISSPSSVKTDKSSSRGKADGIPSTSNILKIKYSEDEEGVSLLRVDNVKTRHLRITAKNYELPDNSKQQQKGKKSPSPATNPDLLHVSRELIALKLQLFGCYLELDRSNLADKSQQSKCMSYDDMEGNTSLSSNTSSDSSSWFSNSALFPAKHLSVNSQLNLIFVCEVSKDVR